MDENTTDIVVLWLAAVGVLGAIVQLFHLWWGESFMGDHLIKFKSERTRVILASIIAAGIIVPGIGFIITTLMGW